jgi:hypothetical protein
MDSMRKLLGTTLGLFLTPFLWITPLTAQQDSTGAPAKDELPKPAAKTVLGLPGEAAREDDVVPAPEGPPNPYAGFIKDVGTGLPLLGTSSTPLRWGSFSIYTFEFIGLHDFESSGTSNTSSADLWILRTGLMFDHSVLRGKSRIVLQYLPQMIIINGQVHANSATNNNVSIGTQFHLTPRLNITVGDSFTQVNDNSLIPQNFLAVNSQLGASVQNNFLNASGNFLADTASATVEYDLSPRTNITFSPSFRYMRSLNGASNYRAEGQAYTGSVALGHALSLHRTVGVSGSYQYLKEKIGGIPQDANYYTITGFYSEQLARTFWVSGHLGATSQRYSGLPQPGGWGLAAGLSVTKNFSPRISSALAYTRGTVFSNYVTRERSDRIDASVSFMVSPRIAWSNQFGYLRELAGVNPTSGKYAATNVSYRFFGNFSLFTAFAYTFQSSGTQQLLAGDIKTLVYGIRWSPPIVAAR